MNPSIVLQVAGSVFRESVRDRVLYNLVAFAVLLIAVSFLLGQLTAGQDVKIIKDLGLAAIGTFGLLIAVFIGVGLVWKEVEKRSIYSLLSKPVRRHEFILGKFCGLGLTLVVNVAVMSVAFYLVLGWLAWRETPEVRASWAAPATDPAMLKAVLLITVELLLVTAIALFFSTFSSPFLSVLMTVALWVIGSLSTDLRDLGTVVDAPVAAGLARGLYYILPNFSAFDVKAEVVHGVPVGAGYVALTTVYGAVYLAFVLAAAVAVFARRDFK
ncbi:MAG: ABC transporter permease [Acidobacteria bacterium]|nr:ABC transporter permease [Acidobacteriota bacterium]